ncbi:MAG TPA: Lrp/AsnC ligand binding domain-containing protein [Flavobacteriales bacterium]|nr:Lrp/AsnC ligand binding domain-containing protein [Flavobacteriales bacterium]HPH81860.1 Lrp/AsnC ligand binding domain-containing protein [Flavobacteriales bacterium]
MSKGADIDNLDRKILTILMNDAVVPYTEIAKQLDVSAGTIHVRMKKLSELGVVLGSQLIINPSVIGFDICAFIGIFLDKGSAYNDARQQMMDIPEIVELHYTTGVYSIFAKVLCRDTSHLREVLNEKIQPIVGIQRTETFITLEQGFSRQINII